MSSEEVVRFYEEEYREADRLIASAHGRLELLRTQQIIGRELSGQPMRVADIGGGPGVYAEWLAGLGHDVELVDPVQAHIDQARLLPVGPGSINASIGDARSIGLDSESVDVAMLLGPLYHLPSASDRAQALGEAHRILRPGGHIFAAGISRFASLHDGIRRGCLSNPDFAAIVRSDIETGHHQNPTNHEGWFTEAYFHRPDELRHEMVAGGFANLRLHGIEGLAGWLAELETLIADPSDREILLGNLDRVGQEPSLLGSSAHMLAHGNKPPE